MAAAVVGALPLVSGTSAGAAPVRELAPETTTVPIGQPLRVATGCPPLSQHRVVEQHPEVSLVVGTGATSRRAARGVAPDADGVVTITVPAWVDPTEPATLVGRCSGSGTSTTTTYDPVPVDVMAGSPAWPGPVLDPAPATREGGQLFVVRGGGCPPGADAQVRLSDDTGTVRYQQQESVDAAGRFVVEVYLYDELAGSFSGELSCTSGAFELLSPPFALTVVPRPQLGELSVGYDPITGVRSYGGTGCGPGDRVTLDVSGESQGNGFQPGPPQNSAGHVAAHLTTTVRADGTFSATWTGPSGPARVAVRTDCGDPATTGYRLLPSEQTTSATGAKVLDLSSGGHRPGSTLFAVVDFACRSEASGLQVTDPYGATLSEVPLADDFAHPVLVPATPGAYYLVPTCDGVRGRPTLFAVDPVEVSLEPGAISGGAGPATPATAATALPGSPTYTG
ncbi:hypothetical protein KSP35_16435 [Aquihabitans sp. G128]|uniref:hypothetical protein n=1 Tax=Aquihabitans sp. G128 TaxID=2849779 RepID=UPI001C219F8A|nr:hypothetical protein [Aquihabitans sp. G128]QXC59946.1 hypothetical protein KSP35_16435 [Aquihabitans sp. G128]